MSLRDLSRPLAGIVVANLVLMLAWSVVLPSFRGADEHVHHDLLRYLTTTWEYPDYDSLPLSRRTLFLERDNPPYRAHTPPVDREEVSAHRADRPTWADSGRPIRDGGVNQLAQHPPLYYMPTAALLRIIDGDGQAPLDRVIWQLRLLSVLFLAPLPLIAADIARRFTSSAAVTLGAAAAILAVPQLTHLGGTVSNDPLMILTGSVTFAGATRLLTGDRRWATAAVTGVAAGLALLTKGFAVPLVPTVALACLSPLWSRYRGAHHAGGDEPRLGTGRVLGQAGLVAVLALVIGGWWWIRNIVVHGNPQPGVGTRERVPVDVDVLEFAGNFSERLIDSFWGNVGWREAHLPLVISAVLTVALVVTVGAACWRRWRRAVLVIPTAISLFMVLAAGWGAYRKTGVSYATQGRYLFASIAPLAALATVGMARLWTRRLRSLPVIIAGVAATLQTTMLIIAVRRYWGGGGLDRVRALVEFSVLPDVVAAGILVLAPVSTLAAVAALWRWTPDSGDRSAPVPAEHG